MSRHVRRMFATLVLVVLAVPTAHVAANESGDRSSGAPPKGGVVADLDHRVDDRADRDGMVAVDLVPLASTADVTTAVEGMGGVVTVVRDAAVSARVPADRLADVEADPAVRRVSLPTFSSEPEPVPVDGPALDDPAQSGSVTGEHVAALNIDDWHAAGYTGQGVRVGIIDTAYTSVAGWNDLVASGDLPVPAGTFCRNNGVTCGGGDPRPFTSGWQHGTGVAELIHDAAPDASLYIAYARSNADHWAAVQWMVANGVDIVSRSLGHEWDGPGNGRGDIAQLVDYAVANGITWFNSAGNYGGATGAGGYYRIDSIPLVFDDGTDNYWVSFPGHGFFLPITGCSFFGGVRWTDFGAAFDTGGQATVASPTDFDVVIFGADQATVLASSDRQQFGRADDHPPIENPGCPSGAAYIAIKVYRDGATHRLGSAWDSANSRVNDRLEIMLNGRVASSQNAYSVTQPATDSNNPGQVAVGAIDPWDGVQIAPYSSWGPTNAGSSPLKPDLVAVSGLSTHAYGFEGFQGTSAAAPVAAGIGAVVLSAGQASTPAQLADYLQSSTWERGVAGPDYTYGHGELRLSATPPAGGPGLGGGGGGGLADLVVAAKATPRTIEPREDARFTLTVTNDGDAPARDVELTVDVDREIDYPAVTHEGTECPYVNQQTPVGVPVVGHICDLGTLAAGASTTVTVRGPLSAREGSVEATGATSDPESDGTNNKAEATVRRWSLLGGGVRLSGADRYATAAAVATDPAAPPAGKVVFLTTGANFPDALAGVPLAARQKAPILLTTPTSLPAATAEALAEIEPTKVIALGSGGVVSDSVLKAAADAAGGAATDRIGGRNRYETAALIADELGDRADVVYLALGSDFPDALAAGPAVGDDPILLVEKGSLPAETLAALKRLRPRKVVALGGDGVVPNSILFEAASAVGIQDSDSIGRYYGADRFATAVAIATESFGEAPTTVYVAVGTKFPDALGGGPPAARELAPMLLVTPEDVPKEVDDYLASLSGLERIVVLGGEGVVSQGVMDRLELHIDPPSPGSGGPDEEPTPPADGAPAPPPTEG